MINTSTWKTSVYPITFIPPSVTIIENILRPAIHHSKLILEIDDIANAPRYIMEVRLTNTYTNNQMTAIIVLTVSLYLFARNCGIVKILFFRYRGIMNTATIISVAAAIHS